MRHLERISHRQRRRTFHETLRNHTTTDYRSAAEALYRLAIARMIPRAHLMLGPEATKEALLRVEAPTILHVATHGLFLPDPGAMAATRATGVDVATGGAPGRTPPEPLLRSGLILARANTRLPRTGDAVDGTGPRLEDSFVTALEIAGMNLWGTRLVVLSACDTGRGDVKLGQGVYGLRRAFTVAGAETVVTSLWKVNDAATRELMEGYYHGLLDGQGRAHAMREAMTAVRAQHPHPYYWAPFVVVGNGAPLRGLESLRGDGAGVGPPSSIQ